MKVGLITQARMGSTRLPGKLMRKILGRNILILFLERIKKMQTIDLIVVATSQKREDDRIVQTVREFDSSILIFRGSENDVLDRYYQCARKFEVDTIVRITSDCPLIDPEISDSVVREFLSNECDYCANDLSGILPLGLTTEVFSFEALERSWKEAKLPQEREHVDLYMRTNPNKFELGYSDSGLNLGPLRWTLDYPKDLEFITEIYKRLYRKKKFFSTRDIIKVLNKEPRLQNINARKNAN